MAITTMATAGMTTATMPAPTSAVRVLCVHGVGHPEQDSTWENPWEDVIRKGMDVWQADLEPSFRFTAYDSLFDRSPLNFATVMKAIAALSVSGLVHEVGDLFHRARGFEAFSDRVRWTAGMIAQWAANDKLRAQTRDAVANDIKQFDPQVILAHSLGSLITYDLLARQPDLVAGRTLVTLGSQIGNPFVRSTLGGRIVPLPSARRWFHLYNKNDDVFTTPLQIPSPNFEQVTTTFDIPGIADHDAVAYLGNDETTQIVWRDIVQPPSRSLVKSREVVGRVAQKPVRRALLVGINDYPDPQNRLEGCVNDTFSISAVLQEMGFAPEDIRVVLNERATADAIKERLHWLLDGAANNDVRIFFYSGHGAQIPAYGAKEEVDHLNECLVPYDFDWTPERAIVDDWFLELYSQLPYDTNFVGILDCCHSGGMTRNGMPKARGLNPPDDIRHRALQWNKKLQMWEQRPLQMSQRKMVKNASDRKKFLGEGGASKRLGRVVDRRSEVPGGQTRLPSLRPLYPGIAGGLR